MVILLKVVCVVLVTCGVSQFSKAGVLYVEETTEVSKQLVLKRWTGLSPTTCLLRCRRHGPCQMAALSGPECLFLKNVADPENHVSNDTFPVTLLKEHSIKKIGNCTIYSPMEFYQFVFVIILLGVEN